MSLTAGNIEIQLASDENNYISSSSVANEKQIIDSSASLFDGFKHIRRIGNLTFNAKNIIDKDSNNISREMRHMEIGFEKVSFVKTVIHSNHPNEHISPYIEVGIMSTTMTEKVEGEKLYEEFASPNPFCVRQETINKLEPNLTEITGNSIELCNQLHHQLHSKSQESEVTKDGNLMHNSFVIRNDIVLDETIQNLIKS